MSWLILIKRTVHNFLLTHIDLTASSGDIQDGLEGLGVSVFDQGTFEEGVLKQLDEEVSRRAAEQQKKFLVNEYSRVTQERRY